MKTIILDYMDGKLKLLRHEPMQTEEMEELLYEKYGLKGNNIEWMTVEDLVLEDLGYLKVGVVGRLLGKSVGNNYSIKVEA